MLHAFSNQGSAGGAGEFVVYRIDIADADGGFYAPVFAQEPLVAVSDAYAGTPSFKAGGFGFWKSVENEVGSSDVVLPSDGVKPEEVAVELVAEPVAGFGLREPMSPFLHFGDVPHVDVPIDVQTPVFCQAEFKTEVHGCRGIVEQVGLDGCHLGGRIAPCGEYEKQKQCNSFHIVFVAPGFLPASRVNGRAGDCFCLHHASMAERGIA